MVALIPLLISLLALVLSPDHTYLYVGGKYTNDDGNHIFTGQMYVEKLTPARVTKPHPIVLVQVCCAPAPP